jgi:hypothetical protein
MTKLPQGMIMTAALVCLTPAISVAAEKSGHSLATAADAKKDAQYGCPDNHPTEKVASEWATADWDKNRLACAADAWTALSDAKPQDRVLAVHALRATVNYLALINSFRDEDLYAVHLVEYVARIKKATVAGERLDARVASVAAGDPGAMAARGLYRLQAGHIGEKKDVLKASKAALDLLEQAVKASPGADDGDAILELAKLYYTLPEFLGGDTERTRQLLADGLKVAPSNVGLVRFAAFVDAQNHQSNEAKARLSDLLGLQPAPGGTQRFADELKGGAELATRLGFTDLAGQLAGKRSAMFVQNAKLLRRLPSANNLHGGVDPITGKDY